MIDDRDHAVRVDAWMAQVAGGASPERLLQVFEEGFAAVWRRAHRTLGEVTLTAVVDRVLYTAVEKVPGLAVVQVDASGLRCAGLRERSGDLDRAQLAEGLRFILVEFLTVLGHLTAEILTPALHAELAQRTSQDRGNGEQASPGAPRNQKLQGEGTKP